MIVVDASVVLEFLLSASTTGTIGRRLLDGSDTLHAPHLIDLEVAQVLRRYAHLDPAMATRYREALGDLTDLPIHRYRHDPLLSRVWQLRHNLTAYDAAYVALAEALPATLLTRDSRIANAPGNEAVVEVV